MYEPHITAGMQVISWNLGPETVPSKTLVPSHPYDLDFRTVFLTYRPSPMEEAAVGGGAIITLPVAMWEPWWRDCEATGHEP